MPGDTLGTMFRVTSFGESHGRGIGIVIEGCPPGITLDLDTVQKALDERKPGQSSVTTQRVEGDRIEVLSGMFEGKTTGTPICVFIQNNDAKSKEYDALKHTYRPGHADLTYQLKYGIRDHRGGGRSSARITAGWVAAGAIAQQVMPNVSVLAYVKSIHVIDADIPAMLHRKEIGLSPVRCPDKKASKHMVSCIQDASRRGDTVGGIIECRIENVPAGLGEPVFDKLDADLAKAMMAINATKGFEIGSGFTAARKYGSENNDPLLPEVKNKKDVKNDAGGILGGISNGAPIIFRVAFKPTSSIQKPQQSIDDHGKPVIVKVEGRHDPCVVPRAVPIVEAMAAIVLCDHYLRWRGQCGIN